MEVYYESDPVMGVNYQYRDDSGRFHHDWLSSMYLFRNEFPCAKLIEITLFNEDDLLLQGKINNGH